MWMLADAIGRNTDLLVAGESLSVRQPVEAFDGRGLGAQDGQAAVCASETTNINFIKPFLDCEPGSAPKRCKQIHRMHMAKLFAQRCRKRKVEEQTRSWYTGTACGAAGEAKWQTDQRSFRC
jgi:hypothetical protein